MSVPRAPIHLVGDQYQARATGVQNSNLDVTHDLQMYAKSIKHQLAGVAGYIFTERSPSCGLFATKVYDLSGELNGVRSGIFAEQVKDMYPSLPVEEAERLQEESVRVAFVAAVQVYSQARCSMENSR